MYKALRSVQSLIEDLTSKTEAVAKELAAAQDKLWDLHNSNKGLKARLSKNVRCFQPVDSLCSRSESLGDSTEHHVSTALECDAPVGASQLFHGRQHHVESCNSAANTPDDDQGTQQLSAESFKPR